MVAVSKLHAELQFRTCGELIHPGPCMTNSALNTYRFLISNAKYFAPIIMLPLFGKIRTLDRNAWKVLKDTLKHYLECVLIGTGVGWIIQALMCAFRNIFGEFRYWFVVFAPTTIGIMVSLLASPRVCKFFQTSIFQITIESFLIRRKNIITRAIADSTALQTSIFMCCSACILHAKQQNLYHDFWFLTPSKKVVQGTAEQEQQQESAESAPEAAKQCAHEEPHCGLYLARGLRTYLAVGLTLDTLKMLLEKVPAGTEGVMSKLWAKARKFSINSTAIFASYMGVYRFTHCYLNRKFGARNMEVNNCVAGFLAGACYIFMPKLTLLTYALVLSIEILWRICICHERQQGEPKPLLKLLHQLPIAKVLYPISVGYLVQTYCYRRRYISSLGDAIINGLTNNYARKINGRVEQIERLMELQMKNVL